MALAYVGPDPSGLYVANATWSLNSGTTFYDVLRDPVNAPDDDTTYTYTTDINAYLAVIMAPAPASVNGAVITSVSVTVRMRQPAGSQFVWPIVRIGGTNYTSGAAVGLTPSYQNIVATFATNPATGQAWAFADLAALYAGVLGQADANEERWTQVYLTINYAARQVDAAREAGSRRLRLRRLPGGVIEAAVPSLAHLDHELGRLIDVSHPDLPSTDGLGAGVKSWQRWPCVLIGRETNEAENTERLFLRDVRDYLVTYWDAGKALKASADYADGFVRLDAGNTRSWARASAAWVTNPGTIITSVAVDADKNDRDGELLESASTNEIIQSAFKNGGAPTTFTGWTLSGAGSNGSLLTEDTGELLFESTITTRSLKLVAGSPIHAADLQAQSTATASITANTVGRLSIWHEDDSGAALSYAVQRGVDSRWWRDSDQTWQVAKAWNPLAVTAVRWRHKSKAMDVGTGATTLTVLVGIPPTGGTAGQVNHCYHVQWERNRYATSTIPTEAAIVTRAADKLTISNPSNAPAWPPDRGTFRIKVVPGWDAADVTTVNKTVAYVLHDADNYDWLYFDGPNARWVYERKASGTIYRATKAHSPVAGTTYTMGARWTSDVGELGLANRTLSIFVDGVTGTDVAAAALAIVTNATLEFGSKAGAENLDGNLWAFEITQQAISDAAVARY